MTGPHISDEDLDPSDLEERDLVNREARADARAEATYEPPEEPDAALTARQLEATRGLAEGHSTGEIAASMGVGITTVCQHILDARRRTGTRSRADLIAFFYDRRLDRHPGIRPRTARELAAIAEADHHGDERLTPAQARYVRAFEAWLRRPVA